MNKISVHLNGGMGNYIFQLATAYAYSLKYNKQFIINTKDAIRIQKPIDTYKDNIFKNVYKFDSSEKFNGFKIYNEPAFNYTEIPYIDGDVYLSGYFQSSKYFDEYEKEIRELFSFPEEIVNEIKEKYKDLLSGETCSIHCRVGDYASQQQYHPIQNINYYSKSIKKIGINKTFAVFSDDLPFCKSFLPQMDNFVYMGENKDWEDFILMTLCENSIIANSSFSWWPAWLRGNSADNKSKGVVIAPSRWFGEARDWNINDIFCNGWIKI